MREAQNESSISTRIRGNGVSLRFADDSILKTSQYSTQSQFLRTVILFENGKSISMENTNSAVSDYTIHPETRQEQSGNHNEMPTAYFMTKSPAKNWIANTFD